MILHNSSCTFGESFNSLTNAHQGEQNGRSEEWSSSKSEPVRHDQIEHNDRFNVYACFDCSFIFVWLGLPWWDAGYAVFQLSTVLGTIFAS